MKIRLQTGFKPLMGCRAYGTTAGSQWWVIRLPGFDAAGVGLMVQPGDDMLVTLNRDRYMYTCSNNDSECTILMDPAYVVWTEIGVEPRGVYARMLRHAVYFDVATKQRVSHPAVSGGFYEMYQALLPQKPHADIYSKRQHKVYLTEEEAIACAAGVAERVCKDMVYKASNSWEWQTE